MFLFRKLVRIELGLIARFLASYALESGLILLMKISEKSVEESNLLPYALYNPTEMDNSHTAPESYGKKDADNVSKGKANHIKNKNGNTVLTDYIPGLLDCFHRPPFSIDDSIANANAQKNVAEKVEVHDSISESRLTGSIGVSIKG